LPTISINSACAAAQVQFVTGRADDGLRFGEAEPGRRFDGLAQRDVAPQRDDRDSTSRNRSLNRNFEHALHLLNA
jgi:hypothetical protein